MIICDRIWFYRIWGFYRMMLTYEHYRIWCSHMITFPDEMILRYLQKNIVIQYLIDINAIQHVRDTVCACDLTVTCKTSEKIRNCFVMIDQAPFSQQIDFQSRMYCFQVHGGVTPNRFWYQASDLNPLFWLNILVITSKTDDIWSHFLVLIID